jgi:NAD-dependent deacetylase
LDNVLTDAVETERAPSLLYYFASLLYYFASLQLLISVFAYYKRDMGNKKRLVVLTGAGISAESGISTFRDSDGLWEKHSVEEICTHEALYRNYDMVVQFYNDRFAQLATVEPNAAHLALKTLEDKFDVQIITQNVDNLHERAGSSNIIHLHGELTKVCSMKNENLIVDRNTLPNPLITGKDVAPDGGKWRPFIVFFNEAVPMIEPAIELVQTADILLIIGTSLQVYPAASLSMYAPRNAEMFLIDPKPNTAGFNRPINVIAKGASEGMKEFMEIMNEKL